MSGKWLLILGTCTAAFIIFSCRAIIALGDNPDGEYLKKIELLSNYRNGQFRNIDTVNTPIFPGGRKKMRWTGLLKYLLSKPKNTTPNSPVPYMQTDLHRSFDRPTVIWFGHSSFLLKTRTANILVDPNFSGYAGPIKVVKAFEGANGYSVKDMPPIDVLVISHDHYDHLDYVTVRQLRKKVKRVVVPVGVKSHFIRWGYHPDLITELNWNESVSINSNVRITATPAHHRSNRTLETNKTLWASYVIAADGYKIYFSGDTGYSSHFKSIGEAHGPFDLALLECGQYNARWPRSHMFPWQTARAARDLKSPVIIPIHWAKFAESVHTWNEPIRLLLPSADSLGVRVTVPYIGEPVSIGDKPLRDYWWEFD